MPLPALRIVDEELPSVVDLFQTDSVGALHAVMTSSFRPVSQRSICIVREETAHVDRQTLTVLLLTSR